MYTLLLLYTLGENVLRFMGLSVNWAIFMKV